MTREDAIATLISVRHSSLSPQPRIEPVDPKQLTQNADIVRATGQRAVKELVEEGALANSGEGKRGKPFKFWQREKRYCPAATVGGPTGNIEGSHAEVAR